MGRVLEDIEESQFSELCSALYEAAQTPELMVPALEQVREAFGFEAFHQFAIDANTGLPVKEWANQRITHDDTTQYSQHYFANDPRPVMAAKAGIGRLFNTRDLMDKRAEGHSEIMQDFLRPRGVGHCIGGQLMASEQLVGYAAFLDAKDRAAKSPRQVDFMRRLMPHLSKSSQLLIEIGGLRARLSASEVALDASEATLFTLTGHHRVVSINRKAESLLRQGTMIKMSTVRTQTQSIMEKLQVKRIPDLIRVVLSVPALRQN